MVYVGLYFLETGMNAKMGLASIPFCRAPRLLPKICRSQPQLLGFIPDLNVLHQMKIFRLFQANRKFNFFQALKIPNPQCLLATTSQHFALSTEEMMVHHQRYMQVGSILYSTLALKVTSSIAIWQYKSLPSILWNIWPWGLSNSPLVLQLQYWDEQWQYSNNPFNSPTAQ